MITKRLAWFRTIALEQFTKCDFKTSQRHSHGSVLEKQLPWSLPGSLGQELWGEAQQGVCQQAFQITCQRAEIQELLGIGWPVLLRKQRVIWMFLKGCKQTRLCTQPRWPTRPKTFTHVASYRKTPSSREGLMVETPDIGDRRTQKSCEVVSCWEV